MRAVLAIIIGLVVGGLVTGVVAVIGGQLFPAPPGTRITNAQQVIDAFAGLPAGAKWAVILSWFGGAFAGSVAAKWVARRGWAAWTIAGLFAIYVLANVLILPMPGWMQALAVALPLAAGLFANHLIATRAPEAATTDLPPA
jgi:hypothetical protein